MMPNAEELLTLEEDIDYVVNESDLFDNSDNACCFLAMLLCKKCTEHGVCLPDLMEYVIPIAGSAIVKGGLIYGCKRVEPAASEYGITEEGPDWDY